MSQRLEFGKIEPAAYQSMMGLEQYLAQSGFSKKLKHLIKLRASQINGCAFCIDMHTKEARADGETEQRLYALTVWSETPFFTPEERAALALTEAVTQIHKQGVPDAIYDLASQYFTPAAVTQILMTIVTINAWNRIAITTQMIPGSYQVTESIH
ncbi:MAG: carboxymuconolactone decarboxylase family protein [Cyanobacteria bacterium P01_A01_bin.17]